MSGQLNSVTEDELHAFMHGMLSEALCMDVECGLECNPDLAARLSDNFLIIPLHNLTTAVERAFASAVAPHNESRSQV
jgi:hypothetical protein